MPEKGHDTRWHQLRMSPETPVVSSEQISPKRWKLVAAASSILIIAAQSPAENNGTEAAETAEDLTNDQTLADEYIKAEQERFRQQQAAAHAERDNPHRNTEEVLVLPDKESIQEHADLFLAAADEFDVNPNYLAAFAWLESRGDPNVGISSAGARGFMQVMPETAADIAEKTDFGTYDYRNISDSIRMAAAVVSVNQQYYLPNLINPEYLQDRAKKLEITAVSYNWGIGGAQQYVASGFDRSILPEETLHYVTEVEEIFSEAEARPTNSRSSQGEHNVQ